MNLAKFVFALALLAPAFAGAKTNTCQAALNVPWNKQIQFSEIEKVLSTGKIIDMREMRAALKANGKIESGTSAVVLVTFEGGVRGVFKPNLWNMGAGEEAAYKIARRGLKSRIVPPTVIRNVNRELRKFRDKFSPKFYERLVDVTDGSIQYFVESSYDLKNHAVWEDVWANVSQNKKALTIFSILFSVNGIGTAGI